MIDVNSVYQQVQTLSRKNQAGYASGNEFNDQVRLVQNILFDYNMDRYEKDLGIADSLHPFLQSVAIPIVAGRVTLPTDYRHRVEVSVGYISGAVTTYYSAPYLQGNEEQETNESYVRRPNIERRRFYHTIDASGIKILPTMNGKVLLKYLRQPVDAVWAFDDNTTAYTEDYNSATAVHFEWEPKDETNLVDLFLYLKGIQVRQSELLEWVATKNLIKNRH